MKKYFTKYFVVFLAVLLALLVTSVALAGTKKGFDGAWEAIDTDGSYQVMVIANDGSYFTYYDFGATVCGVDSSNVPLYAASFEGPPVVVGNEMIVEGYVLCAADNPYYFPEDNPEIFQFSLTYNKQSDTIDLFNTTWSRILKK